MPDQAAVDRWLEDFVERLRRSFRERLVFVGHHGSWARGEARADSDIDTMVVLDRIEAEDLRAYREIVEAMPGARRLASGFLVAIPELRAWARSEVLQFSYGCKVLHGSVEGIVSRPTDADLVEEIRRKAAENLFDARHYLLYPHERSESVHKLGYRFKKCFYALQSWMLLLHGKFFARKEDLLSLLSDPDDLEVVWVTRDWAELEQDRTARPLYYIELLERWSRNMLSRLAAYEENGRRGEHMSPQ